MLECARKGALRMLSEQDFFEPEKLIARRVEHLLLCTELVLPEEFKILLKEDVVELPPNNEPSDPNEVEIIPPVLGKREKPEEEKKQEEMAPQRVAVAMTELELKLYELEEARMKELEPVRRKLDYEGDLHTEVERMLAGWEANPILPFNGAAPEAVVAAVPADEPMPASKAEEDQEMSLSSVAEEDLKILNKEEEIKMEQVPTTTIRDALLHLMQKYEPGMLPMF